MATKRDLSTADTNIHGFYGYVICPLAEFDVAGET